MKGENKMREMIYQTERKMEKLQDAEYKGYRYIILSLGTHPTAYIEIPKGNRLWEKEYDDIDINVHGGLTYASHIMMGIESENWYIGWDYAHAGDYLGYDKIMGFDMKLSKQWSTEEIEEECKNAIEQIIIKYKNDDKAIPLIPEDELYKIMGRTSVRALNYNFKALQEKVNQIIEELNKRQ